MKKIKYLLLLFAIAIISTGCVKYNAQMVIRKDKSMDITVIYALDKTMFDGENSGLKEEDMDEVKKQGYTVEKYTEGNYEGFKITKKIKNIDEVSTDKDTAFDLSGMMKESENPYIFKVVKNGDKSTYYAKFSFDSNDSGLNQTGDDDNTNEGGQALPDEIETEDDDSISLTSDGNDLDLSSLTSSMDLSFTVTLPNSAISTNATTKEDNDKKLTWKLNTTGVQTIEFAFELDANAKDSNLLLYVGIGGGVLLLIILVVVIISMSKKKKVAPPPVMEPVKKEDFKNE